MHVLEAEARVELVDRLADPRHLADDLLRRAVDVGVVLGEGAHPQQAVQNALALGPRDLAELGDPQRQLAVGVAVGVEDEAGAGAVHRPDRVLALLRLGEVHVLLVVVPVAGAVPQLDVHQVRRLDLDVLAPAQLLLHLGLDQPQQGRPVRQPEGHPGGLLAQHEEAELGAEPAVVARLRLLDPLQVPLEVLLREEGRPVDPGQHLAALVAAPVGAGERAELDRLDPAGAGPVRAAAEVLEGAVAVQRDGLDALVADEVLDQLDLEVLALAAEDLDRLGDRHVAALEGLVGGDVLAHRRFDPLEVLLGDARPVREVEVVVEALLDRRADRHLRAGVELHHRLGHHVRGVVADQVQRLGIAFGEDRDLGPVGQRRGEVAQLAVDADRQRGLGQARPDRRRGVGARGAVGQLERRPVGQLHRDLRRGLHRPHATWTPALSAPRAPGARRSAGRGSARRRRRAAPRRRRGRRGGAGRGRGTACRPGRR